MIQGYQILRSVTTRFLVGIWSALFYNLCDLIIADCCNIRIIGTKFRAPGNRTPLKIMVLNFVLKYIGFLAAFCTTVAFFPQAVKVWKTKSTRDISLYMFIIFTIGVFSWLIYGITISDLPIILANSVTLILSLFILFYKIRYK